MTEPKRGKVWRVNFDPQTGAEICKTRPALVVSIDGVGRLPLCIVVPITDWKPWYAHFPWMVQLAASRSNGLSKDSGADAFQVKSVSLQRFVERIGMLSAAEMNEIAAAVALCVGYS